MSDISQNNKRIAKNTALMYVRMLFIMAVSLYISRVILRELGVEDFGIYSAVGGFVAMFAVLTNSLGAAISRYITFELGKNDKHKLKQIFASSMMIQIIISIIILLLAETIGVWFLNNKMTIPSERMLAANYVLQFSIFTFILNLISVPYNATLIAHEHINTYAYISIFEALAKLIATYLVALSLWGDKLILYAGFLCLIALIVRLIYGYYCRNHFSECHITLVIDKCIVKDIFGFAGWNFIGASSGILKDQGINVLINIFCGPALNAARGIAMQVCSAVQSFTYNFITAINPQITKQYAKGNRKAWNDLVFQGARFSFYLLLFAAIPILIETEALLDLWLDNVPEYSVVFVRLIVIYVMVESLSYTLVTLMLATGNIKKYQIIVGGCQMLNFPTSYLILKLGMSPEYTIVGTIIIAVFCLILRLYMLRGMVNLDASAFIKKVVVNVVLVSAISSFASIICISWIPESFLRLLMTFTASSILTLTTVLFVGCSKPERDMIRSKLTKFYTKKIKL